MYVTFFGSKILQRQINIISTQLSLHRQQITVCFNGTVHGFGYTCISTVITKVAMALFLHFFACVFVCGKEWETFWDIENGFYCHCTLFVYDLLLFI